MQSGEVAPPAKPAAAPAAASAIRPASPTGQTRNNNPMQSGESAPPAKAAAASADASAIRPASPTEQTRNNDPTQSGNPQPAHDPSAGAARAPGCCPSMPASVAGSPAAPPAHQNPTQSGEAKNRGRLKNGAPGGDPSIAPRCGARTRAGHPCGSPAMKNGRCRMHGGKSTGPKTKQGLERMRRARTKHGYYSAEGRAFTRSIQDLLANSRALLALADAQLAGSRAARADKHDDPHNNLTQSGASRLPGRPAPPPHASAPVDAKPPAGESHSGRGRPHSSGAAAGTEGENET